MTGGPGGSRRSGENRILRVEVGAGPGRPGDDAPTGTAEPADGTDRLALASLEEYETAFDATNVALLRAVARKRPESIRELARAVERNVSHVHADLTTLAEYGLVGFEDGPGRAKRPVTPYDEVRVVLPLGRRCPDDRKTAVD